MRNWRLSVVGVITALALSACAGLPAAPPLDSGEPGARVLRVSLYPYIPNAEAAYRDVERAFEAEHSGLNLEISLNGSYYSEDREDGGILYEDADVYELDSVFLADFIKAEKIKPLGGDWSAEQAVLAPFARELAITEDGFYGLPHWLCGNFLIYRAGDAEVAGVRSLADLETALGSDAVGADGLVADFFGSSTLGEMYLDALMDQEGSRERALARLNTEGLDPGALNAMTRAVHLLRPTFGRSEEYHDRSGFYARQFSRGEGRVLIGYSEQLYYALTEGMQACRIEEDCIELENHDERLSVAQWPLSDQGSSPIAWVDLLVMDADVSGQKQRDAESFIRFMAREDTYALFIKPGWNQAPRYLLPARDDLYADPDLVRVAPLYPAFRKALEGATPITAPGLNGRLRAAGRQLNSRLPAS